MLLDVLPNLKVVHLVRDPRGVVVSRMKHPSFRGHASNNSVTKEAEFFCRDVERDLRLRKQLEVKYPGRILEVIYEKFVEDPLGYSRQVYDHIGVPITNDLVQFVKKNTKGTSIAKSVGWQSKLQYQQVLSIEEKCEYFFSNFNHSWS
jgi:hypothetical protein